MIHIGARYPTISVEHHKIVICQLFVLRGNHKYVNKYDNSEAQPFLKHGTEIDLKFESI